MAGRSLDDIKRTRKEQSDLIGRADRKLDATVVAALETGRELKKIDSELTDVQSQLSRAKAEVAQSAERAGAEDRRAVDQHEKTGKQQVKEIEGIAARTATLKEHASAIKPPDARIRDGGEVARVLEKAGGELKKEAAAGEKVIRDSEANLRQAEKRLKDAAALMRS